MAVFYQSASDITSLGPSEQLYTARGSQGMAVLQNDVALMLLNLADYMSLALLEMYTYG